MTDLPDNKAFVQTEAVRFRSPVSESSTQIYAAMANFLGHRMYSEKQFFINGPYSITTGAETGVDGVCIFEFATEIIDIWIYQSAPGTGGTTELDIKKATTSGGAFTTIFSTTPKLTSASGSGVWMDSAGIVAPGTGMTKPVLSTTSFAAGTALRLDFIQKMTGMPSSSQLSILIQHRPV